MSGKSCSSHSHCHSHRKKLYKLIAYGVLAFIVVVLLVVFLLWVILRPTKPTFVLQDATLNSFNLSTSAPSTLSTNIQITIASRNPNDRIGIYYQDVKVSASYRNQRVTPSTWLPASYQGHRDVDVWSPFLVGNDVPLAPYLVSSLNQDLNTGMVLINIKVDGKLKWKVGTWTSGEYYLNANCPAYLKAAGDHCNNDPIPCGAPIKYQFMQSCHVDTAL
jgi:hypothetical protein